MVTRKAVLFDVSSVLVSGILLLHGTSYLAAAESSSIGGRVLDDTGKPLPRVVVTVVRKAAGAASLSVAGKDVTTDRGDYRVGRLQAGEYYIRALGGTRPLSASPGCESCCGSQTDLRTTFYPRSPDLAGAKPVAVSTGRDLSGLDIQLARVPVYCVQGEILDTTGGLVPGAGIALEIWNAGLDAPARSAGVFNEGGRFLLRNLPEGSYRLKVTDGQAFGRVLMTEAFKVEGRDSDRLRVILPASAQLPSVPKAANTAEKPVERGLPAKSALTPTQQPQPSPAKTVSNNLDRPAAGRYWQVVSTNRSQAETISNSIVRRGLKSTIAPAPTKPGYFRVLVGPLADAADAAKTRADLEAAGFKNPIVQKY